jgi:hypothetical protein
MVLMATPVDDLLYYEINHQHVPFLYFGLGGAKYEPSSDRPEMLFWLVPPPNKQLDFFAHSLWGNWDSIRPAGTFNELIIGYLQGERLQEDVFVESTLSRLNIEGFEVPLRQVVPTTPNASVTNFLIDSVEKGVTVLYSDASSAGTSVLLNDIGSLALEDSFVVAGNLWSIDPGLEDTLLPDRDFYGYVMPLSVAWWTEVDNPAIQSAIRIHREAARPEKEKDLGYLLGLGSVDLVRETVQNAVLENHSENLTAVDIYEQLSGLEEYDVMGGLFIVDYKNEKRAPQRMRLWQFEGERGWMLVSDWGEAP